MKKIISLLLAAVLMLSVLAGCTGGSSGSANYSDDESEAVTLIMALPWGEQRDAVNVVKEINKKLETLLPNTTLELMLDGSMADKWSLWMSTQRKIDIAHSGYVTNIEDEVRNETYIALSDLVEEYAPNITALKEKYWYSYDNASINGEIYAIPNIQYLTKESLALCIWDAALGYIDTAALQKAAWASDKTTQEFWDIFTAGIKNAEANGVDCSSCVNLNLYLIAQRGYHFIGGEDSNLCYDNSDSGEIIDFYTTDEFKIFCETMKEWASYGWISKDVLTGQWSGNLYARTSIRNGEDLGNGVTKLAAYNIIDLNDPEKDVIYTNVGENKTYYSIPFTSENPVRAIKFLDLINSEEGMEIANMLAYGFEGTHYEFTDKEKGNIKAFEYTSQGDTSVSYGIPFWMAGNSMLTYNVEPYTDADKAYAEDYYTNRLNTLKKHILYNYNFDLEDVRAKFNKILKNNGEYAESIYCGIVDNSDQLLSELLEKNKAAGQEEIMKALQKQADEYIAENK